MLRNCFLDFAVEHWFGWCATESGFAGDIGAIEVWLIDWLMSFVLVSVRYIIEWMSFAWNIILFTLYTTPLSSMIFAHAIPHHLYADDSQLYVSFASGDSAAALNGLQSCLASVQSWMSTNKLNLNPDKTEFLLIENERQRNNTPLCFLSSFSVSELTMQNLLAILG